MFRSLNYNIKIIMTIQVINQNLFTESKRMIKLILCTAFIHYKILRRVHSVLILLTIIKGHQQNPI